MPVNYGQTYNVFDQIRRKVRAKKSTGYVYGRPPSDTTPGQGPISDVVPDVPSDTAPPSPSYGGFAGTMSSDIGGVFVKDDDGVQKLSMDQIEAGLTVGAERATSGEYALSRGVSYGIGADIAQKTGYETPGVIAENIVGAIDPSPFGIFSSLMSGEKIQGPYGQTMSIPSGLLGAVASMNVKNQFEVAEKIKAGERGYHQMRSGGGLISIVPQEIAGFKVGYAVLGTYNGTSQQAINQYASMYGYDPRTVDLMSRPEEEGFGEKLAGYNVAVAQLGGFTQDGMYTSPLTSEVTPVNNYDINALRNHMGLMATMYGTPYAVNLASSLGLSGDIAEGIANGTVQASPVVVDGQTVGYETLTGGVVRSSDGSPVLSTDRTPVTSGTGIISVEAVNAAGSDNAPVGDTRTGATFTSGTDAQNVDLGRGGMGPSYSGPSSDNNSGDASGDTSGGYGSDPSGGAAGSPFAEGGEVPQGNRPVPQQAPQVTEAGFIEQEPEMATPAETVADDKPIDVEEGTFILNAPAVEYMGSADVKKMILDAMKEAEKQGIDINQRNDKIPKENLVSLVVSKGEVVIPPALANIIGYDRLNKINNRGKQEVQKRIDENGQAPQGEPQPAALGGTQVSEEDMYARSVLDAVERSPVSDQPHVPTSNSGVTIGRGFDLSRHSVSDLNRMGVNEETINVLKPFLAKGQGQYGPRGKEAQAQLQNLNISDETVNQLDEAVYSKKKADFDKAFPEFAEALPKDKAMAFSAFYVAGEKGMRDRYKTFLKTYNQTGDIVRAMDDGFLKVLKPGATEYNRALNALNWYFTADDADLADKSPAEQERYTKSMIEAFRRKKELEDSPAGFIPKKSTGKI